ncbi:hypothetical protein BKA63DRAFT_416438 [Paraphoma chrysanthemicola]|nr:hypothetical protein BKA63DRAFT_416438 [Paraphoma chrysanthemicola]
MAPPTLEKKPVKFSNLLLGAGLNIVTTLGQPLEVVKTTMAANRADGFTGAIGRIWARGGVFGFYQGLIPWAWIEASTKGAVLLFVASEAEFYAKSFGAPNFVAGISGGMVGGLAQAYATMGFCTCMKTVEITKHKVAASGVKPPGTIETFMGIYRKEGIRGINRGVNAVAVRQVTNWGSRFGLSRVAETGIRRVTGKEGGEKLSVMEKITASAFGGGLSAWNQPIEVIRVEMQSKTVDPNRPKNLTVGKAFNYIYSNNGIKGLYRGVTPRIGLGVWQTVCMVALGDVAKEAVEKLTGDQFPDGIQAPKTKAWRCDLTALSKVHNLYFVACNDTIHVHRPNFPDQGLSADPAIVLHPPLSASNLPVGIDFHDNHSITRLLVEYLGNDEILLATCDDGDVVGYRIEEIHRAVHGRLDTSLVGKVQSSDLQIRTFLHRNVGASAWGLAVHREARMIAISANTHRVTVLAYALAKPIGDPKKIEIEDIAMEEGANDWPVFRREDHIITLRADSNVPAVFFDNSGGDPTGRWLISSSISGRQLTWDLHWPRNPARLFQMGWCVSASGPTRAPRPIIGGCQCRNKRDYPHGAWGGMFLDPRFVHEVDGLTFDASPTAPDFADLGAQKRRFKAPATPRYHFEWDLDDMQEGDDEGTTADTDEDSQMNISDNDSDDSDGNDPYLSPICMNSQSQRCQSTSSRMLWNTNTPCLLITKDDIFLVQRPLDSEGDHEDLVLTMHQPLHPKDPGFHTGSHDRQCFHTQIPELGVFIIASPIGRAAIFSLTKLRKQQPASNGKSVYGYGFQLEYILPFEAHDETQVWSPTHDPDDPSVMLMGVAVGPVQGMFDKIEEDGEISAPRDRRWRFLMYYTDHSVLSFEIARKRVDSDPGLGDLVV